jgi:hypothetical protein
MTRNTKYKASFPLFYGTNMKYYIRYRESHKKKQLKSSKKVGKKLPNLEHFLLNS